MEGGLLVIDKPVGYTSRDVVNIVERFFDTPSVGHCGTLDPIATGVLVLAVNEGLKVLEFLGNDTKEYIAAIKLGEETNTLDISGTIIKKVDSYSVNELNLQQVINSFIGKYMQEVPLYSSVRVNGKRLYKYARNGEEVELPKREVEIYELELLDFNHDEIKIRAVVSKGTYIRSLIRDIGEKIGIPCTMKSLRRTRQGTFTEKEAITLEKLESGKYKFYPVDRILTQCLMVECDDYLENRILNGSILQNRYDNEYILFKNKKGESLAVYQIYSKDKTKIKPFKMLKIKE